MASTPPDQLGAVRILRDAAGIRTTYEELEIGKDLGSAEFLVTQGQIDQTCDRLEDHHPYYEVGSPFGSTVAPVWMTYLIPRMLFSQTYSVRGLFYKWGFELLGPVRQGVRHTVSATLTEKWIRNDREFVAYEAVCKDESGLTVYRSRRAHVLDFIKRTAPKVGEGAIGTSDARTPEARAAREQNWDRDWPHDDTAAGTGSIEVAPLATRDTPLGAPLPSVSTYLSRKRFMLRQSMYFRGQNPTLHVSADAARQEGLPAPVASAPDVMALACQTAMNFFGAGWIQGGKADLTTVRPSYMGDYLHARGRVKAREELPDGSVRLICDVTVVDQRNETKVAGSVSGLV